MMQTLPDLTDPARDFLRRQWQGTADLQPFVADASARRYFRLAGQGALLMQDPSDPQGYAAYLRLSAHLNALGLSAPRVHASDPVHGLALVEDFGDSTYASCLAQGQDEAPLYELAIDALLHLHHAPEVTQVAQPVYDLTTHLDELQIFSDWFAPAVAPGIDVAEFDAGFRALWSRALAPVATRAETLVLRDFHVDNLMLLPGRTGVARCGLLDFQDAVLGPCEYDLLSLLQDARRDLTPGLEAAMLERYVAGAPPHLGGGRAIRHRYALLGAQRHARILGVFVRLCQRDAKPRYLRFMPRVVAQLDAALDAAGLDALRAYLDSNLPGWAERGTALSGGLPV